MASSALGGPLSHQRGILRRLIISHFFLIFSPNSQVICSLWASQWLSGKESTCSAGDVGSILGSGRSPEEGMATHASILAWRIPWTEELGELQSMGSQRDSTKVTERGGVQAYSL